MTRLSVLPITLLCLLTFPALESAALAPFDLRNLKMSSLLPRQSSPNAAQYFDRNKNGSYFLWITQDTYAGKTFFDRWGFYDQGDPTHGTVNFLNASSAFAKGLAYVLPNGKVVMKGDNTTTLASGQNRDSVRISSIAQYNTGLFILDVDRAPWGCGVWPAFWTIGGGQWPYTGEIDIIEGVHDNQHNQVTWHTGPGCYLNPKGSFTGSAVLNGTGGYNTICDGTQPPNAGCGITEWSRASYGPTFDAQGGGVFAMKWDETGIFVWNFYRAAVPQDVLNGTPNPSTWGTPSAWLDPSQCDPIKYFVNHSIIFDITFCGDWAGNSYATSGCPGTCAQRLMDPRNFDNASWIINTLKVYRKQNLAAHVSAASSLIDTIGWVWCWSSLAVFLTYLFGS